MKKASLMRVSLAALCIQGLPSGTVATCSGARGCNPPDVYTNRSLLCGGEEPTYFTSANSNDAAPLNALKAGIDLIRAFLGSASNTEVYMWYPSGQTSDYASIKLTYCSTLTHLSLPDCGDDLVSTARAGGPNYYLTGTTGCICGSYAFKLAQVIVIPNSNDLSSPSSLTERAIHEYTHAVQKTFGGPIPAWLMEGGAVLMECMMISKVNTVSGSFQDCMVRGGGSSGVITNMRALLSEPSRKTWLRDYGSDRICGDEVLPPGQTSGMLSGDQDRQLYYDTAAFALAFAIFRANEHFASSGGRTSMDFWNSKSKGFWHRLEPYEIDFHSGWPSSVPEGHGWKAALCNFTGHASTSDFFTDFEDTVAPGGVVADESTLVAFLESDGVVAGFVAQVCDSGVNTTPPLTCGSWDPAVSAGLNGAPSMMASVCFFMLPMALRRRW